VVELIRSHYEGESIRFDELVRQLALDEEKKGNTIISKQLLNAQNDRKTSSTNSHDLMKSSISPVAQLSRAKDIDSEMDLYDWVIPQKSLNDVVVSNHIGELMEQILAENKKKDKLKMLRLNSTNRILLCGPPGCGKTSLAYAFASELNRPLVYVRLDSLISSYLGQTGSNIRKVFDTVKNSEAILFLDEFDAIAKRRDDNNELGELKRVVTTLLQNMDLIGRDTFIIAATNHDHLLDEAIWRRFDQVLYINLPDEEQRLALLKMHLERFPTNRIQWSNLVRATAGLSCAVIEELCNKTAKHSFIHQDLSHISNDDFVYVLVSYLAAKETLNYDDEGRLLDFVQNLQGHGLSIRSISKALGLPKSTLSDKLIEV
jgi:SpoVK/Ycf46/Vps4 family AAA+-type ATPase